MREIDLLKFMNSCDLAIMPHIHDEHSGFMNPMKINMYQKIGLPCIASNMPGVDFSVNGLIKAIDGDDFIEKVNTFINNKDNIKKIKYIEGNSHKYISEITTLFNIKNQN